MKTYLILISLIFLAVLYSCSSSCVKENINKTGDAAGQVFGEFATGITTGVKKAIEPKIEVSNKLKPKGLSFGKMTVTSDSAKHDNILIAYLIFDNDFNGDIIAKAFDNKNLEMGRIKLEIKGKKDEAKYIEFHFDKRTDIKNDSRLTLE